MGIIEDIKRSVQSYSPDESIASIITKEMKKELDEIPILRITTMLLI